MNRLPYNQSACHAGFALLELSIVLVIIGLIVGGVLVGRDLIHAAELQSVITDVTSIETAVNTYRNKYNATPGDDPNATAYWGVMSGGCDPVNGPGGGTYTQTCNGDGNGQVDWGWEEGACVTKACQAEIFLFWQHLANAGLIKGQYTGMTGPSTIYQAIVGTNVMASKISGGGYTAFYLGARTWSWFYPNGRDQGTGIQFGTSEFDLWPTVGDVITPLDALSIDQKIDDGLPGLGNVITGENSNGCPTTFVPATAQYNLTIHDPVCSLIFLHAF